MTNDQRCKNCKHWERNDSTFDLRRDYGECHALECGEGSNTGLDGVSSRYSDDRTDNLRTGPEFGCVHWESKD